MTVKALVGRSSKTFDVTPNLVVTAIPDRDSPFNGRLIAGDQIVEVLFLFIYFIYFSSKVNGKPVVTEPALRAQLKPRSGVVLLKVIRVWNVLPVPEDQAPTRK